MTITLAWWAIPIALVLIGMIGAGVISHGITDYDFVTALCALVWLTFFVMVAIGILIGRWMA